MWHHVGLILAIPALLLYLGFSGQHNGLLPAASPPPYPWPSCQLLRQYAVNITCSSS